MSIGEGPGNESNLVTMQPCMHGLKYVWLVTSMNIMVSIIIMESQISYLLLVYLS